MKKIVLISLFLCSLPAMAQTAYSVNGQVITPQSQKMLMDLFEKRGVTSAEQRLELAKQVLTQQAVINQLAAKNRLEIDPAIKAELEETKSQIFLNELLRREVFVNPITDYEFKKEYETLKESYDPNEVKVSHILVKTNSEAKEIIRRIRAGEDFTKLAKELSLDPTTKDNGGQMDFTNVRQISINGFGEAAMAMEKGSLLPIPFKSVHGYHVVKLLDKREVPFPSFEALKPRLERSIVQQRTQEFINQKIAEAKIEDIKPAPRPAARRPY